MLQKNESNIKGNFGEDIACDYLVKMGYDIIARNYRIRGGEIDIIAQRDDIIAFVEVKTRRLLDDAAAAVTRRKRMLVLNAAQRYIADNEIALQPRFDVICVCVKNGVIGSVEYFENAFMNEYQ